MKHHRLVWFLSLLLCVSLASCNSPDMQFWFDQVFPNFPNAEARIESVSVSPQAGSGHFEATVKISKHAETDEITCTANTYSNTVSVVVFGPRSVGVNERSEYFEFDFTEAGKDMLICTGKAADNNGNATFTVVPGPDSVFRGEVQIEAVSVSPKLGSGSFSAAVKFSDHVYSDEVYCYTDAETEPVQTIFLKANDGVLGAGFKFTVTEPGSHTLECKAKISGSHKLDTFTVDSGSEAQATEPPVAQPTTLTLNGTFKLPGGEGACANGTGQYNDPALAIPGTLVLTVDYSTGQTSLTLQGTNTATVTTCNYPTATETWTIKGVTLHGTIDPGTNTLAIAGDVPIDVASSCQIIDETNGGACIAGTQTVNSKITLQGSIDREHSTGTGQITYTGYQNWGVWQAP